MLRIHVLPAPGKMALNENLAEHIIALIAHMRSDGYAVGTSNRVVMILRYMYNRGKRRSALSTQSPSMKTAPPPTPSSC